MLVLTRRPGGKVVIGGGITLTVLGVQSNQVRLDVGAPDQVRILRAELGRWQEEPAAGEESPELVPVCGHPR
jgi:carbon storage regulator CsrA